MLNESLIPGNLVTCKAYSKYLSTDLIVGIITVEVPNMLEPDHKIYRVLFGDESVGVFYREELELV